MKMFDRNIVVYYKIQRKRKKLENSDTTDITNNQGKEEVDKIVEGDIIITDIPNSFDYDKKEIKTKIIEEIEKNIKNICCKIEGYFDQKYTFEYNYTF